MKITTRAPQGITRASAVEAAPKIIAALTVAGLMGLAACNTTAGAGKDISAAGNAIHNSAENAKSY
jgi:predicted small secreted protein